MYAAFGARTIRAFLLYYRVKENTAMPMDGLTLSFVRDELARTLIGGRVDKITQPERDEIMIALRSLGKNR